MDFDWRQSLSIDTSRRRLIRVTAMIGSEHQDQPVPLIDPVEKTIIPDPIPPRLGDGVPKFLDVLANVGVHPQLGIDVRSELALDALLLPTKILFEIPLELYGFKDAKVSQRACPSAASRRGVLLGVCS